MKSKENQKKYIESFSIECLLGPIWWAVFNELWLYLIALLVPFLNIFVWAYLCVKGRDISYNNKEWLSFEQYKNRQTISLILGIVNVALCLMGVIIFIALFDLIFGAFMLLINSLQILF